MKQQYSLKSKQEFNKIMKKGKKIITQDFLIFYENSNEFKIGISIPKKLGNAVFRNYNKRIIKNIIPKLKLYEKNAHIIIIVREKFTTLNFEEKQKKLEFTLRKINEK